MAKMATRRRSVLQDPDEVLNLAQQGLDLLKRHLKWLVLGVGLLVLGLTVWGVTANLQMRREARAAAAFEQVRPQLHRPQPNPEVLKTLDQVIQEFPGTAASWEAELYRANILYQTGKYAEAAKAYETLQSHVPDWAPLAGESLSYCYEALGDYGKAAAVLLPVAESTSGPLQGEVRRRLAWLYEKAGNRPEAARWWQKLVEQPTDPLLLPYLQEKAAAMQGAVKK